MKLTIKDDCLFLVTREDGDPPAVTLAVPDGIKKLCHHCFLQLRELTVLLIPPSVEEIEPVLAPVLPMLQQVLFQWDGDKGTRTIGMQAFHHAPILSRVILPDTMRKIGAGAFQDSPAITELRLPDGPCVIANNAFQGCYLQELTIPPAFFSIAFINDLKRIDRLVLADDHPRFTAIGDVLYSKDLSRLHALPHKGGRVDLPAQLRKIPETLLDTLVERGTWTPPDSAVYRLKDGMLFNIRNMRLQAIMSVTPNKPLIVPDSTLAIEAGARSHVREALTISLPLTLEPPTQYFFRIGDTMALRLPETTVYWPFKTGGPLSVSESIVTMFRLGRETKRREAERMFRHELRLSQQFAMAVPLAVRFRSEEFIRFTAHFATLMISQIGDSHDAKWLKAFLPFGMTAENAVTLCDIITELGDPALIAIVQDYRGTHFPFRSGEMRL